MKNKVKNISVISTGSWVPSNLNDQEVKTPSYKILIKSLVLNASIGIHEFEKKKKQKISISLEISVFKIFFQLFSGPRLKNKFLFSE